MNVSLFDPKQSGAVMAALRESDLDLSPTNVGNTILVPLPRYLTIHLAAKLHFSEDFVWFCNLYTLKPFRLVLNRISLFVKNMANL